jgi:hypothetical protein
MQYGHASGFARKVINLASNVAVISITGGAMLFNADTAVSVFEAIPWSFFMEIYAVKAFLP